MRQLCTVLKDVASMCLLSQVVFFIGAPSGTVNTYLLKQPIILGLSSFDSVYFLLCIGSGSIFWNLTKNTNLESIEFTKYLNTFLIWHRFLNMLTFWMFLSEDSFVSILLTICYSKYNAIFQQLSEQCMVSHFSC